MVGVAVNVTEPPLQIEVALAMIDTAGTTDVTVMLHTLLVAVVGLAQGSLLVITAVITSALLSVELVNVDAVSPGTFTPLTCH